jgi:hypothetical protein
MPTINNYTFSDVQFTVPENSFISDTSATAVITISPLTGYTATASDFALEQGFSNQYVQSVTFTQDGDNVLCTVTFVTSAVMPSANVTIPLCVIGSAEVVEITIAGTVSAVVGTNVTGDTTETDTPYSNSGAIGETESLFTRTYNAASGYYWSVTPSINVTQGNQSNYNIVQTPTFDSNNRLTNISYDVNYIYPNNSISGDHISIRVPNAKEIYAPVPKIRGYNFDTSLISRFGEERVLTVYGDEGAEVTAIINDGTSNTTIIDALDIPSSGELQASYVFPERIKGSPDFTYTITLSGDLESPFSLANPFTVEQKQDILVRFLDTKTIPVSGWTQINKEVLPLSVNSTPDPINTPTGLFLIEIDCDITASSGTIAPARDLLLSDFSNTSVIEQIVDGATTNSTTLVLDSTTGIVAGDKFNNTTGDPNQDAIVLLPAPYNFTVSSVDSSTNLTISPAMSAVDDFPLTFIRNKGTFFTINENSVTQVDSTTVNITASLIISRYGNESIDFTLDLDNIITHTP